MSILVTGGAGFIGSHICARLHDLGHEVVVADNFCNSSPAALAAVHRLTGRAVTQYELDVRDTGALDRVFRAHEIEAVIHLAGKKAVRESVQIPVEYYDVNIGATTSLLKAMLAHEVTGLVFSSSCSIYGANASGPIHEASEPGPTNPYSRTKLICEQLLADACVPYSQLSVISLRYFNPIGAHPSGVLGEDPSGVPGNVVPYMMQAAAGRIPPLRVFGTDFETPDGSGVRDYVHVMDVAEAHCLALDHLDDEPGLHAFNIGSGTGVSVLQLIAAFEAATGVSVPYELAGRQPGDVATLIADPGRIEKAWGWRAGRTLAEMLADSWRFQALHPIGYLPVHATAVQSEPGRTRCA